MAYEANHWVPDEIITTPKMNNIEDGLLEVSERALYGHGGADQASEGIHSLVYVDKGNPMPSNPTVGDTVFVRDGSDFVLMEWNGEEWVPRINPDLTNRLQENLDKANEATQTAIETNNISINETIEQVAKEQADLAIKDGDFINKAQVMADKALSDAKADSTIKADKALSDAKAALNTAKTDLNSSIQKEITDRTNSVTALDTKAQGYVSQAKSDAIAAAKDADGIISKKIDDTASSLSLTIDQNEQDAEGKISTVSANATLALDQIKTKVSQNDYDKKTGDLTTQLNTTTQTATQSKTDIVDIKAKDNSQDSRMLSIENDATGTKTTVSDLKKTSDTQSGNISTLQQRADGFERTVEKVNNIAISGRNYLLRTTITNSTIGAAANNQSKALYKISLASLGALYKEFTKISNYFTLIFDWEYVGTNPSGSFIPQWNMPPYGFGASYTTISSDNTSGTYTLTKFIPTTWSGLTQVPYMGIRFDNVPTSGTVTISNMRLIVGNMSYVWTPAPEDVDSATSKAQQTAEQALTQLSTYKTDADGRITKAQTDISATAKEVATKISQTIFDSKTGELSTATSNAQQTANTARTEIANYKTEANGKLVSQQTAIDQNASNIALAATKVELNDAKSDYNAKVAQINLDVDKVETSVSQVNNKVTDLSVGGRNYVLKSDVSTSTNITGFYSSVPSSYFNGKKLTVSVQLDYDNLTAVTGQKRLGIEFVILNKDGSNRYIGAWKYPSVGDSFHGRIYVTWDFTNNEFKDYATNQMYQGIYVQGIVGTNVSVSKPKLEIGTKNTDWTPAPEDISSALSVQQITIDGISDVVSKQTNDINSITSRVQTAEGSISTATNNISGLQSSQTQTANQIVQEIKDRKTEDSNTLQSSKDFTTSNITSAVSGVNTTITQTANGILGNIGATNLFVNSEFTRDYGWRIKNGTVSYLANQNIDGQYHGIVRVTSTAAAFQGYWLKNIPVRGGAKYSYSTRVHFTNNNLTNGTALMDLWFVDKDGTRINQGTGGKGKLYTAQITSPYWVDLYIDGSTAPNNAVYAQVSLIVNNAGSGMTADFTMPTFTATDVHQPYTPNDDINFQLGLFKDNWSIGLTDNMSKIVSGIVADTNSMSVISDKVIIKSPNTQITGTAWITSAMIGNAQIKAANIADAAITSAKISELDVAKLSGNVSSFIQTNWDGQYKSVKMTPIGMTITTNKNGSSIAQFNQDGLLLGGPLGVTNILNGSIELTSDRNEYIGSFSRETMIGQDNVDYLMVKVAGWHTSNIGDNEWDLNTSINNTIRGGDGIGFAVTNSVGTYDMKMSWDSSLIAGYKGRKMGWHVEDLFTTHQKAYFENGFTFGESYNGKNLSLHTQGSILSNGNTWYGFFDGGSKAGFGTDQSQDVLFYVKGKAYSLYTMLNKLGML